MHLFSSPNHSPCIRLRDQLKICSQTVFAVPPVTPQSKTNNVQIYKPDSLLILSCYTDQSDLAHFTWFFKKKSYIYMGHPQIHQLFFVFWPSVEEASYISSLLVFLLSVMHVGRGLPVLAIRGMTGWSHSKGLGRKLGLLYFTNCWGDLLLDVSSNLMSRQHFLPVFSGTCY